MGQMKTPGVYVVEKNAFPNSVVEVETAVPAFIGYTEKATNKGKTLHDIPWRISSMSEYREYFGGGPTPVFDFKEKDDDKAEPVFSLRKTGDTEEKPYLLKLEKGKGDYLLY